MRLTAFFSSFFLSLSEMRSTAVLKNSVLRNYSVLRLELSYCNSIFLAISRNKYKHLVGSLNKEAKRNLLTFRLKHSRDLIQWIHCFVCFFKWRDMIFYLPPKVPPYQLLLYFFSLSLSTNHFNKYNFYEAWLPILCICRSTSFYAILILTK